MTDYYGHKLAELQGYLRLEKYKRLAKETSLWAENHHGRPWNEKSDGPLRDPPRIHVSLHNTKILTWTRGKNYTEFPSGHASKTTFRRIGDYTNFQVWTRKDSSFISLRYSGKVLPYPVADKLCNETGELVDHCDDWLNRYNAAEFYENAPKAATLLTRALLAGKLMHGWPDPDKPWDEDEGVMASPDIVHAAHKLLEDKKPTMALLMGALEKTNSMPQYREFLLSLMPGSAFQHRWGTPRGEKAKLDRIALKMTGEQMAVRGNPISRPRDAYKLIKEEIVDGLMSAARLQ